MDMPIEHIILPSIRNMVLVLRDGRPTNSTIPPPTNFHGQLKHWAVVGYGFNISSTASSVIVIAVAIILALRNKQLQSRPTLRISVAIAVCDMIYSICNMFIFDNNYMSRLSELHLRLFLWMMAGSTVTFVLLSSCMGLQVLLRVLTHNQHITKYIQPWYELTCFVCGFLITHPYMYLFREVRWIPTAQLFFLDDKLSVSRRNVWLIHWMWVFAGIIFLIFVTVTSFIKLLPTWREVDKTNNIRTPEKLDMLETKPMKVRNNRQKYVRAAIFRISGYFLIPIITQSMVVVGNLLSRAPYWLFVLANIMPATQGMLNMMAFIMSPALDSYRQAVAASIGGAVRRRGRGSNRAGDSEMGLHFPIDSSQPSSAFSTYTSRKQEISYS